MKKYIIEECFDGGDAPQAFDRLKDALKAWDDANYQSYHKKEGFAMLYKAEGENLPNIDEVDSYANDFWVRDIRCVDYEPKK